MDAVNEDFILGGKSVNYDIKPAPLKNSQLTRSRTKTKDYDDVLVENSYTQTILRGALHTLGPQQLPPSTGHDLSSLKRSEELKYEGKPHLIPKKEDRWYTRSPHVDYADYPVDRYSGLPMRTESPLKSTQDLLDAYLMTKEHNRTRYNRAEKPVDTLDVNRPTDVDPMAKSFFPYTLGEAYNIRSRVKSAGPPPKTPTFSAPSGGLPQPKAQWRPKTAHNKWQFKDEFLESQKAAGQAWKDPQLLAMAHQAPAHSMADTFVQSPYTAELARLRMERLRLEEQMLAEVKRLDELERTRGPNPKWYELKTPNFHYEARKNNQLLSNMDKWEDLIDYRNELKDKSLDYRNTMDAYTSSQRWQML